MIEGASVKQVSKTWGTERANVAANPAFWRQLVCGSGVIGCRIDHLLASW